MQCEDDESANVQYQTAKGRHLTNLVTPDRKSIWDLGILTKGSYTVTSIQNPLTCFIDYFESKSDLCSEQQ